MSTFESDLDAILEAKLSAEQKNRLRELVQRITERDLNIDEEDDPFFDNRINSLMRELRSYDQYLTDRGLSDQQYQERQEEKRRSAEEAERRRQEEERRLQKISFRSDRLSDRISRVSAHPVYGRYLTVLNNGINIVQPSGQLVTVSKNSFDTDQKLIDFIRFIKYGTTDQTSLIRYKDTHGTMPESPYADLKDKVQTIRDFGFNISSKLLNTDGATFRTRFCVITSVVVDYSGPYFQPRSGMVEQVNRPGSAIVEITQAGNILQSWRSGSYNPYESSYPVKNSIPLTNVGLRHLGEIIDTIDTVIYASSGLGSISGILLMGDDVVEYVIRIDDRPGRGRGIPAINVNSMNVEDPMALRKLLYNHIRSNIGYTGSREKISIDDEEETTIEGGEGIPQESREDGMKLNIISELASASLAAAPAAPPKEAPTKPRPSTPAPSSPPKPSPGPWGPWPSTLPTPAPKAKKKSKRKRGIKETFERSVDRSTQDFWSGLPRNSQHAFGKHPLFAMYGLEKAKRSWQSGVDMLKRLYPNLQNMPNPQVTQAAPGLAMNVFQRLLQVERPHHQELAELAVDLVHQVWGVPKHLMDAKFSTSPGMSGGEQGDNANYDIEHTPPDTERIESLRGEINKRMTMNTLTQGAAVQNMQTIHHMASEQLNRIAPELLQYYSKFSAGALSMYWLINFANLANLADYAIGDVRIVEVPDENREQEELLDFRQEDDELEQDETSQDQPPEEQIRHKTVKIQARAMVFPVLVQELVKGAMEYLTTLSMANMDEGDRNIVLRQADRMEYEPWQIQIGPQLWNAFLKIVPRGATLATVVHKFAGKDPSFVHKVLADTLEAVHRDEDPLSPREALAEMLSELDASPSAEDEPEFEAEDDESWRGDDLEDDMEDYV